MKINPVKAIQSQFLVRISVLVDVHVLYIPRNVHVQNETDAKHGTLAYHKVPPLRRPCSRYIMGLGHWMFKWHGRIPTRPAVSAMCIPKSKKKCHLLVLQMRKDAVTDIWRLDSWTSQTVYVKTTNSYTTIVCFAHFIFINTCMLNPFLTTGKNCLSSSRYKTYSVNG